MAPKPVDGSATLAHTSMTAGQWRHAEVQQRAITALLAMQKPDGRFGGSLPNRPYDIFIDVPITLDAFAAAASAIACMGLRVQAPRAEIDSALKRGYGWLLATPRARRVSGDTFYNVWTHIYVIEALSDALADSRFSDLHAAMRTRLGSEVTALQRLQSLDGGWGYYDFGERMDPPSGSNSTSFVTAAALLALKSAHERGVKVDLRRVERGIAQIEHCRFGTGGYAYGSAFYFYPIWDSSNVKGSLGRSQACNRALRRWNHAAIDTAWVQRGLDHLFEFQHFIAIARQREFPHEAWYSNAGYYYYFGHWYAAQNLEDIEAAHRREYAARLVDTVVATQSPDDSFWDFPLYDFGKAYGTGFALLTIEHCRRVENDT